MTVYRVFLTILNMGLTASVVIAAVLAARGLMGRLPKKYCYMMWLIVGIRLVCPVMAASPLSVFNLPGIAHEADWIPSDIRETAGQDAGNIGQWGIKHQDSSVSGAKTEPDASDGKQGDTQSLGWKAQVVKDTGAEEESRSAHSGKLRDAGTAALAAVRWGAIVWIAGMLVLLSWNIYTAVRMRERLRKAVRYKQNIYECDNIPTPFVMGLWRPKIYIPFGLGESEREYIIEHEKYHIRRKDYLVKFAAVLLTVAYWFHPLVWVSYFCMVRDMEMSCDEYVLGVVGQDIRANYSESLLGFATNKRRLSMGLLAFGETYTRKRVKNIMKFQKQKKWIGILAVMLVLVVGVACLTNAKEDGSQPEEVEKNQDGRYKIPAALETINDYELKLFYLSDEKEPEETEAYEGDYILETSKNGKVYDRYALQFPSDDTLTFPSEGIELVVKDYDGDGVMDDFGLGQGQGALPYAGNWMFYQFFTVDEDGSIVQFALSTEDGNSIMTLPGEYSADFECRDGEIYYTGFGEDGTAEPAAAVIRRMDSEAEDAVDAKELYQDFVEELKTEKKYKDGIYTASMKSGKGEDILLVTESVMSDGTTVFADVYQCVDGKIVYIAYVASTGSGYPLCRDGEWLLSGFHHSSEKLRVDYGMGTAYTVEGYGLGKGTGTIRKYIVKESNPTEIFTKEITEEEAGEADYYYDGETLSFKGTPIVFDKVG